MCGEIILVPTLRPSFTVQGWTTTLIGRTVLPFLYNHAGQPKVRQCTIPQKWYNCTTPPNAYNCTIPPKAYNRATNSGILEQQQNTKWPHSITCCLLFDYTPLFVVPVHFQGSPRISIAINTSGTHSDHWFEFRKLPLW